MLKDFWSAVDEANENRKFAEHEHRFELACFTCNDEPDTLCGCGWCRRCGPMPNYYEIEREQIEADRTRRKR